MFCSNSWCPLSLSALSVVCVEEPGLVPHLGAQVEHLPVHRENRLPVNPLSPDCYPLTVKQDKEISNGGLIFQCMNDCYLSASLPVCSSTCLLCYLSPPPPVCLATCLSRFLSASLHLCLATCLLRYVSAWLPVCFATWLLRYLSAALPVCFTTCLLHYLSALLPVCIEE